MMCVILEHFSSSDLEDIINENLENGWYLWGI